MKKRIVYVIDGWLDPPPQIAKLSEMLLRTGYVDSVAGFDRKSEVLRKALARDLVYGNKVICLGHSFGAHQLAKISLEVPLFAAGFIDAVNEEPMWSRNWLKTGRIEHAVAWRRKYTDLPIIRGGPPSVGVLGATNFVVHCGWASHNKIISHISLDVVMWVKQLFREDKNDGTASINPATA